MQTFELANESGMSARLTDYGAAVMSLLVPFESGIKDVALGFESAEEYLSHDAYFGCIVGRFANRIRHGRCRIEDTPIQLSINADGHHLHGGEHGFDKQTWKADPSNNSILFTLESPDGDQGYPGDLSVTVRYTITELNTLRIEYRACTNKPTLVNLTNHLYFNLSEEPTILRHELQIMADTYTPADDELIPTGEILAVADTPLDFRKPRQIGDWLPKLGFDHNLVLQHRERALSHAATLRDPTLARAMETWTTQPALQLYTGNFLDGSLLGKNGNSYIKHSGLCLETQAFPDAPNHERFPSVILRPGEIYGHVTEYRFSSR